MEKFLELVFKRNGDVEEREEYENIDDARADFIYFTQETDIEYVYLNEIETDYQYKEERVEIDSYVNEEFNYGNN